MSARTLTARSPRRPRRIRRTNVSGWPLPLVLIAIAVATFLFRPEHSANSASPEVQVTAELDMVLIPTPARPVAKGERLASIPISEIQWPRHRINGEYITNVVQYQDWIALAPLSKSVPIPLSSISAEGADGNAVIEGIPRSMRAITVKVDPESAVEGWARSGSYVDVIVIRTAADPLLGLEAKVVAENIKILSAGRSTAPIGGGDTAPQAPATVTLLTTQEDSLKVKTAASIGKLTFSLRGSGDQAPAEVVSMDQRRLIGGAKAIQVKMVSYDGYAKGPDGKFYVLGDDEKWSLSNIAPPDLHAAAVVPARPVEKEVGQ